MPSNQAANLLSYVRTTSGSDRLLALAVLGEVHPSWAPGQVSEAVELFLDCWKDENLNTRIAATEALINLAPALLRSPGRSALVSTIEREAMLRMLVEQMAGPRRKLEQLLQALGAACPEIGRPAAAQTKPKASRTPPCRLVGYLAALAPGACVSDPAAVGAASCA